MWGEREKLLPQRCKERKGKTKPLFFLLCVLRVFAVKSIPAKLSVVSNVNGLRRVPDAVNKADEAACRNRFDFARLLPAASRGQPACAGDLDAWNHDGFLEK